MSTTHQFQADILYANPDPLCKVCGRREAEHNDDEPTPTLKQGWLKRQLDQSAADVATWPEWLRKAAGVAEPTTPKPHIHEFKDDQNATGMSECPCGRRELWIFAAAYEQGVHDATAT